jgi:CubicO group peptidase (beta-lactamase class C family)
MATLPDDLVAALDHWFDGTTLVTPSISYAVFDRSGVLYHHGVGEFRLDGRAPAIDTVYRIASMSKSFEAAVVLVLEEHGLLAQDDLVSMHVPEFRDPVDAFGVTMPVTVRMLMENSSGLPEDNGWADHELGLSRDDFLAVVEAGLDFAERPGDVYQYSNIGFWLLGVIVENVTGREFGAFATETLLEPLELSSTRYDAAHYEGRRDIAPGFGTFDEGATWFDRPFVGTGIGGCAASMFSTVSDIARWSGWLSSAFEPDNADDSILSRAARRSMQRLHTSTPSPSERAAEPQLEGIGYGLGLFVENDVRFGLIAQHSGGLPGFSSNMRWHTESGLGVVVFANTNGVKPGVAATTILRAVLDRLEPPARVIAPWPSTLAAAAAVERAILGTGDVAAAGTPLSPNLLSDVPAEVRAARLARSVAGVGGLLDTRPPLADRLAWAASAAHIAWTIPGRTGELECRLEMTPTRPALVQRLDVEVHASVTDSSPVTRHYRPSVPADR